MKLQPRAHRKTPVHALAKELGLTSRQLIDELCRRGEHVTSPQSVVEAPVERAILREFGSTAGDQTPDATLDPQFYGAAASTGTTIAEDDPDETFGAAYARIKARPSLQPAAPTTTPEHQPAILQALLEVVMSGRRNPPEKPGAKASKWERDKANQLNGQWGSARLNGLTGDDATVIAWIQLSHRDAPQTAIELSRRGISPQEASLHIGYGGRIDPRFPTIYERVRQRTMHPSEAITAVRAWRERRAVS